VDTLFDADLSLVKPPAGGSARACHLGEGGRGLPALRRDCHSDDDGNMKRIVEKPTDPISKLANIGLYYIRDWQLLFKGIQCDDERVRRASPASTT
jgi:glucose-1-phosphate thymidylyltransferase